MATYPELNLSVNNTLTGGGIILTDTEIKSILNEEFSYSEMSHTEKSAIAIVDQVEKLLKEKLGNDRMNELYFQGTEVQTLIFDKCP